MRSIAWPFGLPAQKGDDTETGRATGSHPLIVLTEGPVIHFVSGLFRLPKIASVAWLITDVTITPARPWGSSARAVSARGRQA